MKYRIKITTYANGKKDYSAYVYERGIFWGEWVLFTYRALSQIEDYKYFISLSDKLGSMEIAIEVIESHYNKNCPATKIEFEYINK